MANLFENEDSRQKLPDAPLADRMRPLTLDDVLGQDHLVGEEGPLRQFLSTGYSPSIIFWGPPGVGKTTIALLIADLGGFHFEKLSAVDSGVKEVRSVIAQAKMLQKKGRKTLLFIDEIHRFNKSQQDALLFAVEKGIITLVGATTENPSFEVNSALLSRCQVYRLFLLNDEQIKTLVEKALKEDKLLKTFDISITDWDFLLLISGGDARIALNSLELAFRIGQKRGQNKVVITRQLIEKALQQKTANYDKKGESHYDTISAFIKSLRGSDPDAAMLWMAKMLDAGEDPRFIARRMVIFASEDIGNADPFALSLAISVFQAVELIGMPEARINLAQGVTYLASCNKSNSSYWAINKAEEEVKSGGNLSVPMHLRNAPTKLMKDLGYHEGYQYPHSFDNHFIKENYFPEGKKQKAYYKPGEFGKEKLFKERLELLWKERYGKEED